MSSNAFSTLEQEYNEALDAAENARARLAEWRAFWADALKPETAESVQAAAVAEGNR